MAFISQIAFSHGIPPLPPFQSSFVFCVLVSILQMVDMTMKNDKAWLGDLLGGPLMSRESRIIAELMLTAPNEQTWQEQIVGHNILQ
ncbi:BrxA family protein, partial [Salmonella enterica]